MLLLPENAESLMYKKIFIYKSIYHKFKGRKGIFYNNVDELSSGLYSIKIDKYDDYVYYCNKCHKKFHNNYQVFYKEEEYNSIYHKILRPKCPSCGETISYYPKLCMDTNYLSYVDYFLDGNKLKIKFNYFRISTKFYYGQRKISNDMLYDDIIKMSEYNRKKELNSRRKNHNRNPYIVKYKYTFVLNLDSGMSYILPHLENGKRKGEFSNVTYSCYIRNMFDYDLWNKIKPVENMFLSIYDCIRDYKMKKYNFYIPTFLEQLKAAGRDRTSFDFRHFNYLLLFNRYPGINLFSNFIDYTNSIRFGSNTYYSRYVRSKIPLNTGNIFKALSDIYGAKYQKSIKRYSSSIENFIGNVDKKVLDKFMSIMCSNDRLENYYENKLEIYGTVDFRIILLFIIMKKLSIQTSNIIKFLDVLTLNLRYYGGWNNNSEDILDIFLKYYKKISKAENFNENSFFNKISDAANYSYFIGDFVDSVNMYISIKAKLPDYIIDTNDNLLAIHDLLSKDYNRLKCDNLTIKYNKFEKTLPHKYDFLDFRLAKDTYELIDVGSSMNICVGSYGNSAYKKECTIIIGYDYFNKPVICIEVRKNKLIQTKLACNNYPKLHEVITEELIKWIIDTNLNFNDTYDIDNDIKNVIYKKLELNDKNLKEPC